MTLPNLAIDDQILASFCRRNHVRELLFFGSVTRHDFTDESDIDVAIEYEPSARVSLFDFSGHELELSEIVGRTVHLTERKTIPANVVETVLKSAIRAYAA